MRTVRIGCGAGFSGDRIEPAVELAMHGDLDYLVFECLAERTIALAQQAKARDPRDGYDPWLVRRMEAVLPVCLERGVRIVTNMGAANPTAAAAIVKEVARRLGHRDLSIGTVVGDDVLDLVKEDDFTIAETGEPVAALEERLVSANAYIGAEPIAATLACGPAVVITGRSADPSLFVGALAHELHWAFDDWDALGRGTLAGHLLECAGQVTGGYFADPGRKEVEDLSRLGFPIAEVPEVGPIVITKVTGSGGRVTPATCKEQLLYEIHDPSAYVTPDTVADFSRVRVTEIACDRVAVDGATGGPRPDLLKVSLGYRDGYVGEGQISYAGAGAPARARLAAEIVIDRLRRAGISEDAMRCDLIGIDSLHGTHISRAGRGCDPYEVRLRLVGRAATLEEAQRIGQEVEALYTNGPAGGGGAFTSTREVLSVASTFVPRALVSCTTRIEMV
jgi:Acyclic terpene utilisation family protein AtuA